MGEGAAQHRFQDAVAELRRAGASRVVVVPLLVSSFSGHYEQVRYLAGAVDTLDHQMMHHLQMSGIERATGTPMVVTSALDDSPELAHVLAARAKALAPSSASKRALFLFGHGPNSAEDYAAWMWRLRAVADTVKAETGFASVAVELVRDDAPASVRAEAVKRAREIIGLQRAATRQDVIVVPILVSSGDVANRKLPADLTGLPIVYAGTPLLPHEEMAAWVERRVREASVTP
jgi:sirohydrochlorin ferrochelatase